MLHVLNRAQPCGFPMVYYASSCPDLLRPQGPMLLTPVFVPRGILFPSGRARDSSYIADNSFHLDVDKSFA